MNKIQEPDDSGGGWDGIAEVRSEGDVKIDEEPDNDPMIVSAAV